MWWMISALCAFFVKGLCGFANTLVLTSMLSFSGTNNIDISPVDLLIGLPPNAIMVVKERRSIQWKVVLLPVILVILGDIPGILFLKNSSPLVLKIICGGVIVLVGVEMLLREYQLYRMKESKAVLVFIGILSGVLCGLYGIGALLSAYVSRATKDTRAFKANICTIFLSENIFRVTMYIILGIFTLESLKWTTYILPAMLGGLLLGMLAAKKLNEKIAKRVVIVMLILSGIAMILNSVL
ncbi:MAG: sulfite exporter TauE/SafE family protein [Clostridiales bacterium]|nr:sulfite exporter TauE/SafE family protein [Clostridiales bacterium]